MKSYKTTIIGAIFAALTAIQTYQSNGGNLDDWKLWVFPTLIAAFGFLAKDFDATGKPQT